MCEKNGRNNEIGFSGGSHLPGLAAEPGIRLVLIIK